jgi:hypothetical protein
VTTSNKKVRKPQRVQSHHGGFANFYFGILAKSAKKEPKKVRKPN